VRQYGYVLVMNDMRSPKIEYGEIVCWAETAQELIDFMDSERADEPYRSPGRDGPETWGKTFREGGPLEWYNDPGSDSPFGHGVREFYMPTKLSELRGPA
jgi:hypothetical protein